MREACKARAKPGETLGPDSICPGLKLGYARLRSAVLRGRDRDGYGESQSAECPKGLRGAIVGVVMSHERTRGAVIKDGKTYEHLDIFQVFYLNGQSEELELDEIASSLEPRQDMSDAPDGLSAPELARRALRARGHDVGGPRYEAPRFVPRPGDVAERVARNARLHHSVNVLRKGSPDVAPACYEYVQRGGVYEVDDLVNGARVVTRIPEGAQGEDGLENLEVLAAAAGAVSKGRLSVAIPPDLRRRSRQIPRAVASRPAPGRGCAFSCPVVFVVIVFLWRPLQPRPPRLRGSRGRPRPGRLLGYVLLSEHH